MVNVNKNVQLFNVEYYGYRPVLFHTKKYLSNAEEHDILIKSTNVRPKAHAQFLDSRYVSQFFYIKLFYMSNT